MESCNMNFIKYLLFIFNLIFAISGIGIIVGGAVVLSEICEYDHFANRDLLAPPIILIVAGGIIFIIAFLGCFGAIRESYNLLIAFAVLLLIIFIIELAVGIAAAVYNVDFEEPLKSTLKRSMANYSESDAEKIAWDNIQKKFKCCGVESYTDWEGQTTPLSCCHSEDSPGQQFTSYCVDMGRGKYLYNTGCYSKLRMKVDSNSKASLGIGIGLAFIQVLGIILACWLAHSIKKEAGSKEE